jgi:phenylalanyl-tRNA synthetase alpha chain
MANLNITQQELDEQARLITELDKRTDSEAGRIKRYLNMTDLTRQETGPIRELVNNITSLDQFKGFDIITIPEVVQASASFDLFNFPEDHVARSNSDTYYVDDENILRPHTTVMWWYYFQKPEVRAKIEANQPLGVLSYGKVYRKDEIDRNHMNIFHQMDGLYLHPTSERTITQDDLKEVLANVVKAAFGENIKYRFNDDTFPYTHSSLEMEVDKDGQWVEVLGAGLVQPGVLEKLNVDPNQYNGWAFGFGLERLAIIGMELPDIRLLWSQDPRVTKQMHLGQKFVEVSKYPSIVRDISFIVDKSFEPNNYFDLIRDIGGDLVEQVELLDKYENTEKFGADKISYTYRITYRSTERTLENEEVEPLQAEVYNQTAKQFDAELR